jgi:hypothetical protein
VKKQGSSVASSKNQSSILGFFSKTPSHGLPVLKKDAKTESSPATLAEASTSKANAAATPKPAASMKKSFLKKATARNATPVPSSDAPELPSSQDENRGRGQVGSGLPRSDTHAKTRM